MAIKRYKATADNTIVNAFKPGWKLRATGSNTGMADVVEVYSIYGRVTSGSQELSRVLMKFPTTTISSDRTAGTIPASGSVSFYLRLFNAQHSKTVPRDYKLVVNPMFTNWQEGTGLDLESYKDNTLGNVGSNWMSASNTTSWNSVSGGGDWLSSSADYRYEQTFDTGLEDLEIDVTPMVERWIKGAGAGGIANYGVGVKLSSSYEARATGSSGTDQSVQNNPLGATKSYYTKRFFGRGSEFFFKRPVIEARWDSSTKDERGDFYLSSSLASAAENLNTIYLYNYIRGVLRDIPDITNGDPIFVNVYSGSLYNSAPSGGALTQILNTPATGGWVSTGIYSCSLCVSSSSAVPNPIFDLWYSGSKQYFTGTIAPLEFSAGQTVSKPVYYLNITNLKGKYRSNENARFNLYVRNKNWNPTIYTVAQADPPATTIYSASYRVYRTLDAYEAIPYGTGSDLYTLLSYDVSGNYFDFDMSSLESGYTYAFKFAFYDPALASWTEQPETFKFRVEDYEY
tara:strand:+ start:1472 stop:3010 length:1539 start_codon:yes stop_codon:yes gene_type:complete